MSDRDASFARHFYADLDILDAIAVLHDRSNPHNHADADVTGLTNARLHIYSHSHPDHPTDQHTHRNGKPDAYANGCDQCHADKNADANP